MIYQNNHSVHGNDQHTIPSSIKNEVTSMPLSITGSCGPVDCPQYENKESKVELNVDSGHCSNSLDRCDITSQHTHDVYSTWNTHGSTCTPRRIHVACLLGYKAEIGNENISRDANKDSNNGPHARSEGEHSKESRNSNRNKISQRICLHTSGSSCNYFGVTDDYVFK